MRLAWHQTPDSHSPFRVAGISGELLTLKKIAHYRIDFPRLNAIYLNQIAALDLQFEMFPGYTDVPTPQKMPIRVVNLNPVQIQGARHDVQPT